MVKNIVKDIFFLKQPSVPATKEDMQAVNDLLDTLKTHKDECVGLAGNMIGVNKRIIVFNTGIFNMVMINPVITKKSKPYETEESCLSLSGSRKTTRYEEIDVEFCDISFNKQKQHFSGFAAQIIQHETDHCNGIII